MVPAGIWSTWGIGMPYTAGSQGPPLSMVARLMMLKRTMECIRRTMAAALKAGPNRSSEPGRVAVVKKLAVSLMRWFTDSLAKVPVMAMGRPEYLFMKVATKAPRIT